METKHSFFLCIPSEAKNSATEWNSNWIRRLAADVWHADAARIVWSHRKSRRSFYELDGWIGCAYAQFPHFIVNNL
jgi:hypothetical protein